MAKRKVNRYVVTLYTGDQTVITSYWAANLDDARSICRTELEGARSLRVSKDRQDGRAYMWPDGKMLNRDLVAKPAVWIAEQAGIDVPPGVQFLMVMGEKAGPEDRFSGEKLSPVLTIWKWDDFGEMIGRMKEMHRFSGEGHSASIHSERDDRKVEMALKANVGRVNCNMPHAMANSGSWFNANPFTDTLGGGSWAGNMTSENVNWKHFLNYTWLSEPTAEYVPTDEDLFGDYLAKWGGG